MTILIVLIILAAIAIGLDMLYDKIRGRNKD